MSILKIKNTQGNWVNIPTVKGDVGNGIQSAVLNNDYTLTLTFTDGTTYTTPSIRGEKGDKGDRGEPATGMEIHICSSSEYDAQTRVPTIANPNDKTFYLVPTEDGTSPDLFTEWVYVNSAWEMFGSAKIDLSGYLTDVTVNGTSVVTNGVAELPEIPTALKYVKDGASDNGGVIEGTVTGNNANVASGTASHAEGVYTKATGLYAHSEGSATTAGGNSSHSEGSGTNASGNLSHAEGTGTKAIGSPSHAEGSGSESRGDSSHAEGYNTKSIGNASHSEGSGTNSDGYASHAEGGGAYSTGDYSHAEGTGTRASANSAHAEGAGTRATGDYSHSEGSGTVASGDSAHAEGGSSVASGVSAHAEGGSTNAQGNQSHAEGGGTTASGQNSHAEGFYTVASGQNSHAEGFYATANHRSQHVFGEFNIDDPSANSPSTRGNYVEIVGNGISNGAKSNARTLDWNGNEKIAGSLTLGMNTQDETGISASELKSLKEMDITKAPVVIETASGAIASFADGADDMPMKSLVVDIEPVQSGSGDPSPDNVRPISGWTGCEVNVCGKNLLPMGIESGSYNYGLTITVNEDKSFYVNKPNSNGWADITIARIYLHAGTYTMIEDDDSSQNASFTCLDENGNIIKDTRWSKVGTLTISQSGYYTFSYSRSATANNVLTKLNLFHGTVTASEYAYNYEPYKGTTYPISWQSEAGTVYGGTLDVVSGALTAYPYYPSYNGETLTGHWISDRDVYAEGTTPTTGAQVVDMGGEGTVYHLTTTEVQSLLGQNHVWADCGGVEVEYRADTKMFVEGYAVEDVQINGTSIVENGVANVPIASGNDFGVIKVKQNYGHKLTSDGILIVKPAIQNTIKHGGDSLDPLVSSNQHWAVFYGLSKVAGYDEKNSSLPVGIYTEDAKSAISEMLGGSVSVSGTTPTIVAKSGIRYVCGEVATLDFTPSASGICDVVFTSGSTPTVLTVPNTVKWANGFDPTALDADTTYEINIMDGLGVCVGWT